ncbi:hypothetical protein LTR37_015117 [Vermiconidia calcicola]|uniref:Uncharacterized protein n=1 Tax=Vermiconidia calcicola TaxID=1690605 RepID=A0ACC3MSU6_9PEZI|nr:hypothetical protein LTR37_015117 [Vermiconidia calcicola]
MAAKTGIFEPLRPPLHQVSDTIQGPYAFLAAEIMIVLSGLVVAAKLHMAVSTYLKLRYSVAICTAVQQGLGSAASELTGSDIRDLSQSYYASNILLFLSLGSSKSAVALLTLSIQPTRWVVVSSYALLTISIMWALSAAVVVALQCSPNRWVLGPNGTDTCIDQFGAQIAIRVIDIVTDIALAILPAFMIAGVQTTKFKFFVVSFVFGVRLITPIFTSVSIASLSTFYDKAVADRPSAAVRPSIWTSIAVNMSLVTACVPSIKRLISDWKAGVVNAGIMEPFEIQNSIDTAASGQGISARNFRKSQRRAHDWRSSDRKESVYLKYAARAGDNEGRVGSDRDSETRLTDGILQTVDFRVDYNAN